MTVTEQFKGIQVKIHNDEMVPMTMANKTYCSQTRKGDIHTIHPKEGMGMLNFPGYFFPLGPLARKILTIN